MSYRDYLYNSANNDVSEFGSISAICLRVGSEAVTPQALVSSVVEHLWLRVGVRKGQIWLYES
jgi:hypothetical protein